MVHWLRHMVLMLALAGLFCSCTQIEDARHVVAEADSLRAVGTTYDDSLAIAKAAATLSHVRIIYPTDYARANYYYGRLLRNRGDHPEAMQAFLRTIHSRTNDHEILARSYSNIATLCHWADEYALSYEMYQKCAQQFWLCSDSVMYYYALNAIAFELVWQKQCREALALTDKIEQECIDTGVLTKIWETRAEAYKMVEKYDSAIYCAGILYQKGYYAPTGYVIKAQSYLGIGQDDSAVYYAQKVMDSPYADNTDKYNVLFILSNNDSTIEKDEIRELNSQRADIGIKELTPESEKLAIAIDYLLQDMNRKPDLIWLWAILTTVFIIATPSIIITSRKRKKHQLYSQKATEAQEEHRILSEQNQKLEQQQIQRQTTMRQELEANRLAICNSHDWQKTLHWKDFDTMCDMVNKHFFLFADKLKTMHTLDEKEIRLCVLVFLDMFSLKQMADILSYSETGIRTYKSRVNDKLGNKGHDLRTFLVEKVILGSSNERKM